VGAVLGGVGGVTHKQKVAWGVGGGGGCRLLIVSNILDSSKCLIEKKGTIQVYR